MAKIMKTFFLLFGQKFKKNRCFYRQNCHTVLKICHIVFKEGVFIEAHQSNVAIIENCILVLEIKYLTFVEQVLNY
jgi:hypothetical protein